MPFTQITYQIIFSTKRRLPAMVDEGQQMLYRYLYGILKEKKCHVYQINGTEKHLHILTDLHPSTALANLVKDLKVALSLMIKKETLFANWPGWQDGYGAFTYSKDARPALIAYVKNQKEHHTKESSRDEYLRLLREHGVDFDEKYII